MDIYTQAVLKIIQEQQAIIGPIAWDQAKKVKGLQLLSDDEVKVTGSGKDVLSQLVSQYAQFFGNASIEVCKDAIKEIKPPISSDQLPDILR